MEQVDENELEPHDDQVTFRATKNGKFIITPDNGGYNGTGFAHLSYQTAIYMLEDCGLTLDEMRRYLVEVMTRQD